MGENTTDISEITKLLYQRYNYLYLLSMIDKGQCLGTSGNTLVVGSSHAVYGIDESCWNNSVVNCSLDSQDIFYDYLSAKEILDVNKKAFDTCIIIMGYYIPFQDLSRSTVTRLSSVLPVYYPVLGNPHNWTGVREEFKRQILPIDDNLLMCLKLIKEQHSYFGIVKQRTSYFNLNGKQWKDVSTNDRDRMGRERAEAHNKHTRYTESFDENVLIMNNFVEYLFSRDIRPVVVVTPFTKSYLKYIDPQMRSSVFEMLNKLDKDVELIDFNES